MAMVAKIPSFPGNNWLSVVGSVPRGAAFLVNEAKEVTEGE